LIDNNNLLSVNRVRYFWDSLYGIRFKVICESHAFLNRGSEVRIL